MRHIHEGISDDVDGSGGSDRQVPYALRVAMVHGIVLFPLPFALIFDGKNGGK
jgi:hypothetical protein